jgi:protein-disulfide isomerase-like protein with CxxC motif
MPAVVRSAHSASTTVSLAVAAATWMAEAVVRSVAADSSAAQQQWVAPSFPSLMQQQRAVPSSLSLA